MLDRARRLKRRWRLGWSHDDGARVLAQDGQRPSPRPDLLEVDKWAASAMVRTLQAIVGDQPYPADELLLMTAAFAFHRPETVIDIGTHLGKSARIWHELSTRLHTASSIHTVDVLDPTHPEFPGAGHAAYVRAKPVQIHIGDGAAVAEGLVRPAPRRRYLLFLDGDHRFETVSRELEVLRQLSGGAALIHDTFFQPSSRYNHGPYLAIQQFLKTYTPRQVLHLQSGLPGMSYIALASD